VPKLKENLKFGEDTYISLCQTEPSRIIKYLINFRLCKLLRKTLTNFRHLYSNVTIDVVINQISYVVEVFRFPGRAVVLPSAADKFCIRKLNKVSL
jgi:hypothetical protein